MLMKLFSCNYAEQVEVSDRRASWLNVCCPQTCIIAIGKHTLERRGRGHE